MSDAEDALAFQLSATGHTTYVREYRFDPDRQWRFDFAWPGTSTMLAVEVEGGQWVGGRHTSGRGFAADITKYNAAVLAGWRLLRVTPAMVDDGSALDLIERALRRDG